MATPEADQMEAVFKSVRTDVDPVSGNEVPPGSLPEEVRDDVPAMLSEGEYVVPADVLRFYGMKFFEDLRTQAKMGLADMEANGRIGGEPVMTEAAPMMDEGVDITPEEQAEIESMLMAVGGFVPDQTQSNTPDPYMQQQAMYRSNEPVAMGNTGYNEGGDVVDEYATAAFDPKMFSAGYSFLEPAPDMPSIGATESETVTLYGPDGEVRSLVLPGQQATYDALIELGYSTTSGASAPVMADSGSDNDDDSTRPLFVDPTDGEGGDGLFNIKEMDDKQLELTARGIGTLGKIATGLSTVGGILPASIVQAKVAAQYNNMVEELDARGVEHTLNRKKSIFGGESGMYDGLNDTDKDGRVSFGDTWLGDVLGFDKDGIGRQGDSLADSLAGTRRTTSAGDAGISTAKNMTTAQVKAGNERSSSNDRDDSWSGGSVATNQSKPSSSSSSASKARASAQKAADKLGTSLATGGR